MGGRSRLTADERFDAKWRVDEQTGCHLWFGARDTCGYGNFGLGARGAGTVKAHSFAWSRVNGPVPKGLHLDHYVCSTPSCVNPDHMKIVTPRENLLRSDTCISAINARKVSCARGHPFTPENTYIVRGRGRHCRACAKIREAKRQATRPTTVAGRLAARRGGKRS